MHYDTVAVVPNRRLEMGGAGTVLPTPQRPAGRQSAEPTERHVNALKASREGAIPATLDWCRGGTRHRANRLSVLFDPLLHNVPCLKYH